jgi:predicted Zn-dependent peptidase
LTLWLQLIVEARLFQRLRSDTGLVYQIEYELELHPVESALSTASLITFCADENTQKVVEIIYDDLVRFQTNGLLAEECAQLRNTVRFAQAQHALDVSPERYLADYAAEFVWTGRPGDNAARYHAVLDLIKDPAAVKSLINELLPVHRWRIFEGRPKA